MKFIKGLLLFLVCLVLAAVMRMGLRHWTPRIYASIYGTPEGTVTQGLAHTPDTSPPPIPTAPPDKPARELTMTGKVWGRGQVLVIMSDGTVRSLDDNTDPAKPLVERIARRFMDYKGKRYYLSPHVVEQVVPQTGPLSQVPVNAPPPAEEPLLVTHTEESRQQPTENNPVPPAKRENSVRPVVKTPLKMTVTKNPK